MSRELTDRLLAREGGTAQRGPLLLAIGAHLGEVGHRRADTSIILRSDTTLGRRSPARGARVVVQLAASQARPGRAALPLELFEFRGGQRAHGDGAAQGRGGLVNL